MTLAARLDAFRSPLPASFLAVAVGAGALVAAPLAAAATMLAITLFCVVLWITNPVPPAYTGVLCIGLVGAAFSADLAAEALFETIPTERSLAVSLAFVFGATILLNLLMEGLAVASVLIPFSSPTPRRRGSR